jgi:hypothetical protein
MSRVEDVVNKFNILDDALKHVYSKVDPFLVVSLIFDRNANKKYIYTVEAIMKPAWTPKLSVTMSLTRLEWLLASI